MAPRKVGIRSKNIKYKLRQGSTLLKVSTFRVLPQRQLKSLIHRFATREAKYLRQGSPRFYFWRVKRLQAVEVYEYRFSCAPEMFKKRKMPVLDSYYTNNGAYLWPSSSLKNNNKCVDSAKDKK